MRRGVRSRDQTAIILIVDWQSFRKICVPCSRRGDGVCAFACAWMDGMLPLPGCMTKRLQVPFCFLIFSFSVRCVVSFFADEGVQYIRAIILNIIAPGSVVSSSVDSALEKERAWGQSGSTEFHKGSKLEASPKRFGGAFTVCLPERQPFWGGEGCMDRFFG